MAEDRATLDKFGRFIMENLRDPALERYDGLARGHQKAPSLAQLQADLQSLSEEQRAIVRRCVVSAVDSAIHDFLFKLQEVADFEDDIQVLVDGKNVVRLSDGIHGELFGEDGWQARYSKFGKPNEDTV